MKRIMSLSDLLTEELEDLLNAENQMVKALAKMKEASQSSELKALLDEHIQLTKKQIMRLEKIFMELGRRPESMICKAMQGLLDEARDVVNAAEKSAPRDAAIIGAMQRVQHYKIAGYGTAREHAADLGHTRVVEGLSDTLQEERAVNFHYNELAKDYINPKAAAHL